MRSKFKDEALDQQFEKDGYVVIPNWISLVDVEKMRQIFTDFNTNFPLEKDIFNTLLIADSKIRTEISDRLMELLNPAIEKYFTDYLPLFSYFLIKPTSEHRVNFHRDSSVANEEKFEYLTIWLPLEDVDVNNGCISIVPGSHKLFTYEVPISEEWPYLHLSDTLKKHAIDVPMKAGDLLLFFEKTIHESYPNQSGKPRHVVCTALMHPEIETLHYQYDKSTNTISTYQVDPWFYFRNEYADVTSKFPFKKSFAYNPPKITPEAIDRFYGKSTEKANGSFSLLRWLGLKS